MWFGYSIYIMFRVANFEKERVLFLRVLREIEKRRKKNLEGEAFWDSLVLCTLFSSLWKSAVATSGRNSHIESEPL